MDELIYDAYSIFFQIMLQVAPDKIDTFEFQLTCYIFAGVFVLIVLWSFCKILSAFANTAIGWLKRGE